MITFLILLIALAVVFRPSVAIAALKITAICLIVSLPLWLFGVYAFVLVLVSLIIVVMLGVFTSSSERKHEPKPKILG